MGYSEHSEDKSKMLEDNNTGTENKTRGLEYGPDYVDDPSIERKLVEKVSPQPPLWPAFQNQEFEEKMKNLPEGVNFVPSFGALFDPNSEESKAYKKANEEFNAESRRIIEETSIILSINGPKNKDATLELIDEVKAHPGADRLDLAKILGFQCVTQKGLYKGGERIVYIRPDALLPIEKWTEDYRKYSPKRIKAVRLRNEWSEGIIVPFEILSEEVQAKLSGKVVGDDVSEILGVTHYEPPAPQDLKAKGGLPFGIHKTDEERFENLGNKLPIGSIVDIQLKIDGQSCSYFYHVETDRFGVLGRSMELHEIFENNYTAHIARYDIKNKLIEYCKKHNVSLCIRGESYGEGIQGMEINAHSKLPKGWAMFSTFLIEENCYAEKGHPHYFKTVADETGLPVADMIEENVELTQELIDKYSTGITVLNGKPFEGVVVKTKDTSFKIINKHYDSKK